MVKCGTLQHYHSNLSKVWNVSQSVWVGRQQEAFLTCKIMTGDLYRKCRQKKERKGKKKNQKQEKEKKSWWGKKFTSISDINLKKKKLSWIVKISCIVLERKKKLKIRWSLFLETKKNVFLPAVMKILHNDWHRKLNLSGFGVFSGGFCFFLNVQSMHQKS